MPNNPEITAPARLERRLQVSAVLLSLLGTLVLGMGQMNYRLPLLVLLTGSTSLLVTDFRRWIEIGTFVANIAAIAAVVFSISDYLVFDTETQLLAIANLLVYLQIILQFQKKTIRIFWQLVVLSLLQVVVACALNLGVMFGGLLIVYLCCVLRVLMLMYVQRETESHSHRQERDEPGRRNVFRSISSVPADSFPTDGRWFGEAVSGQLGGPAVNRSMWRLIALTSALTMVLTAMIFSAVPRYHREAWEGIGDRTIRIVGFSDEVTVGDLGPVIQDPQVVMRVQLIDPESHKPFSLLGRALFRGAVLTDYQGDGVWKRRYKRRNRQPLRDTVSGEITSDDHVVRQEITMPHSNIEVMFSIYPPVGSPDGVSDRLVKYDRARNQLLRTNHDSRRNTKTQYVVHTLGIRDGAMAAIAPTLVGDRQRYDRPDSAIDVTRLKRMGPKRSQLPELIALAERVDRASGLAEENRIGRARAIARHLSDSGDFTYTLQAQERDSNLDPIEDFISNTRRGHCEYYASALTLMLRSRDIPARLVVGFVGDEWNDFGSFYQVRQLHSHTWVEVYLRRDQLPDDPYYRSEHFAAGGWLTLDATPADTDDGMTLSHNDWLSRARELADYAQLLWTSYVVDMTPRRQERAIYEPIRKRWKAALDAIDVMLGGDTAAETTATSGVWVDWAGVLVGIVGGAALLAVLIVVCRPLRNRLARVCRSLLRRPPRETAPGQPDVPFYKSLEKMLAREGIHRQASQTQREFAFAAGAQLADRPTLSSVAGLPRQVADAFYRVRFGGHTLDNTQAQAVEQALSELGRALAASRKG